MIKLTVKNQDGSTYWVEHFNDETSAEKWLREEESRKYWNPSRVTTIEVVAEPQAEPAALEQVEARYFLAETDWYIIREMDTGAPCPPEIKEARAAARLKI